MYTEKYAHFQSSLKKSNDVFETYKIEMSKVRNNFSIVEKIQDRNDRKVWHLEQFCPQI